MVTTTPTVPLTVVRGQSQKTPPGGDLRRTGCNEPQIGSRRWPGPGCRRADRKR